MPRYVPGPVAGDKRSLRPEHLALVEHHRPGAMALTIDSVEVTGSATCLFADGDPQLGLALGQQAGEWRH
jgi:hypothetical protein